MRRPDGRNVATRQTVHGSAPCARTEVTGRWMGKAADSPCLDDSSRRYGESREMIRGMLLTDRVVSENANGAEISNPRGVVEIRGDQPTRHWLCDRQPRAELSSKPSIPPSLRVFFLYGVAVVITEQAAQSCRRRLGAGPFRRRGRTKMLCCELSRRRQELLVHIGRAARAIGRTLEFDDDGAIDEAVEHRHSAMAEIHNRLGRIVLEVAISSTCYRGRHQVGYAQVWI